MEGWVASRRVLVCDWHIVASLLQCHVWLWCTQRVIVMLVWFPLLMRGHVWLWCRQRVIVILVCFPLLMRCHVWLWYNHAVIVILACFLIHCWTTTCGFDADIVIHKVKALQCYFIVSVSCLFFYLLLECRDCQFSPLFHSSICSYEHVPIATTFSFFFIILCIHLHYQVSHIEFHTTVCL